MNSLPHKSLHHRCTGRPHTGRYQCSHWDTSGCCSPRRWSVGNTHIFHPRSVPCHCSCLDTWAGCSRLLCSPDGTHTSHPHICRCHCTRQGRRTLSNLGLPIPGYRGSCRCRVGRYHGHYSLCPLLKQQKCEKLIVWLVSNLSIGVYGYIPSAYAYYTKGSSAKTDISVFIYFPDFFFMHSKKYQSNRCWDVVSFIVIHFKNGVYL